MVQGFTQVIKTFEHLAFWTSTSHVAVQNASKGDIPKHFNPFRSPLSQSHGYNTKNGCLPRLEIKNGMGQEGHLL